MIRSPSLGHEIAGWVEERGTGVKGFQRGDAGGLLAGTTIMRQCHGSYFDITTGAVIHGPATKALHVYKVQEVEGSVRLLLRQAETS